MLFLFCVALGFILRSASSFIVLPCSLFSCFFIPFSVVITSLGEEGVGLCASPFSLPLGVGGWLWFVIVALPGLFYFFFFFLHIFAIFLSGNMGLHMYGGVPVMILEANHIPGRIPNSAQTNVQETNITYGRLSIHIKDKSYTW